MNHELVVSFVHGYSSNDYDVPRDVVPALWTMGPDGTQVHTFPFPRNVSDFNEFGGAIAGQMPLAGAKDFKKLPRFGFTGLAQSSTHIFAGSWNGVYRLRRSDFGLDRIITNPLMNDLHGIYADDECVITVLTGKDAVITSDFDGNIVDHFCVFNDLTVKKDPALEDIDWRFLSKQFRGATGTWHFNFVQKFGDEIWLTSRNLGCFVVVDPKAKTAHIRAMNHKTPILLHDGRKYDDEYYFTSIDGKIIIASESDEARAAQRETFEGIENFNRDLACDVIRLEETEFGREPNWCRGISRHDDTLYVTVDGRYDSDLSFGLLGLTRDGEKKLEERLRWKDVGSEKDLRFVTGFDVLAY